MLLYISQNARFRLRLDLTSTVFLALFCSVFTALSGCRCSCEPPSQTGTQQIFQKKDCAQASVSLNVPMCRQEKDLWCWAASGQMCMQYLSMQVCQCDEADQMLIPTNVLFSPTFCCDGGHTCSPEPCNCITPPVSCPSACPIFCDERGWPPFDAYHVSYLVTDSAVPLTFEQLTEQIGCDSLPVVFSWAYDGSPGKGHIMVATGYYTTSAGIQMICINNPAPPQSDPSAPGSGIGYDPQIAITYNEYVSSNTYYTHWKDFYSLSYQPNVQSSPAISGRSGKFKYLPKQ
jgi:hypothetical protein